MTSSKQLSGKTGFITGANQGIGAAIALEFAREGANLYLFDWKTDHLPGIAEEARAQHIEVRQRQGDVTRPDEVEEAVAAAEREMGGIDTLVNCAGIFQSIPFLDYPLEEWKRVLEVNVTGTFLCCQALLKTMSRRGRGKIINLSSVAGRMGSKYRAAYSTSKHAVIGLTRCIAIEFAENGITANAICPGMIDTEMYAQVVEQDANIRAIEPEAMLAQFKTRALKPRLIPPVEIARLAVYLASPASDGMTGQALTYSDGIVMQ